MKYVRLALGALLGLYVLLGLYHMGVTVGHKAGLLTSLPGDAARVVPLMNALAWWQVAVWVVAIVAYAIAAWRLLRGGKALVPYLVAFVLDPAVWLIVKSGAVYNQVFSASEQQMDYYIMGALLVGLVLTWWTERGSAPSAAAA